MVKKQSVRRPEKNASQKMPSLYGLLYAYRHYVLAAGILAVVFASMATMSWQLARLQANDTPRLLATQVTKQLDAGLGLSSINMGATDLANDPVPFVIVYDKDGKAVAGSGYLDSQLAVVPKGVLEHAKAGSPNAVTWQPQDDVRIASVTMVANEYYVLGGQSLAQTEDHSVRIALLAAIGYGVTLVLLAGYASLRFISKR